MPPGAGTFDGGTEPAMRVAHLISPAGLYGKEQWLLAFLKYVDRSRFEPVVVPVSVPADASFEARVLGCGVEIVRLGVRRNFSPAWVTGAASLVRERRIDCVHAHDYRADFIAFAARTLTGVTVVSTPHGWSNGSRRVWAP
jgi:hypothetical protein